MLFTVHVYGQDNPLVGEWQYDREQTIQQIKNSKVFSAEAKNNLLSGLPSTKIRMLITESTITYITDNETSKSNYKIIKSNTNSATIQESEIANNVTFTKTLIINNGLLLVPTGIKPSISMAFKKNEN